VHATKNFSLNNASNHAGFCCGTDCKSYPTMSAKHNTHRQTHTVAAAAAAAAGLLLLNSFFSPKVLHFPARCANCTSPRQRHWFFFPQTPATTLRHRQNWHIYLSIYLSTKRCYFFKDGQN
jgi:hypothetical protein